MARLSPSPDIAPGERLVGRSRAMAVVRARIHRVASTDYSVLLEGETGTGKELVARALHRLSRREAGPFVAVNCAGIPQELAESHLFGHEQGAFTGARGRHPGLMEQADRGTLFLDDIAELPLPQQAKLLRSLQEREIVRLGSSHAARPVSIDIRVVVASHGDLVARCREQRFREDLYYRVKGYRIRIPPLRERERDVLELAQHFLCLEPGPQVRLGRDAEQLMLSYSWPGNVRELRWAVLAARVDARCGRIGAEELAEHLESPVDVGRGAARREGWPPAAPARSDIVIRHLRQAGPSSIGDLEVATAIPRSSLRRVLTQLEAAGTVVHAGDGRARRYSLSCTERAADRTVVSPGASARDRGMVAVAHLQRHGTLARRDYVELTGVCTRTADRDLAELVRRGVIRSNGRKGRAGGYVLVPHDPGRDG